MTRFARAKGSKASNERQPESATPWSEMKQQLLQKKHDEDNKEEREEANARRINIYKEFLAEHRKKESKEIKWADFPGVKKPETISKAKQLKKKEKMLLGMKAISEDQKVEKPAKKNKPQKKQGKKEDADVEKEEDFDIEEGASADESSEEFYDLKAKLDKILDTEEFKQANGEIEKESADIQDGCSDDDDVPEESSSKVEQPKVKVKKVKQIKKTKLEIPSGAKVPKTEPTNNSDQCETAVKTEKKKKLKKNKTAEKQTDGNKKKDKEPKMKKNKTAEKQTDGNKKKDKEPKMKKKVINLDELDEKSRIKVERKQRKRQRQVEKRQVKKAQKAAEKEAQGADALHNDKEQTVDSRQQNGKTKRPIEKPDVTLNNKRRKISDEGQGKFVRQNKHLERNNDLPDNTDKKKSPQVKKKEKQKKFDAEKARRKPLSEMSTVINGKAVDLEYFDGFPIKRDDADRLKQLKRQMISKGLPRSEINNALKLERRRAEKALTRLKKEVCFNCRLSGHNLSECPQLNNGDPAHTMPMDICFKCGSTEHKSYECKVIKGDSYKFATCFICKEQGHLSKQCPDNPRGLYPKGGACNVCGDVTHLKKDCPQYQSQQGEQEVATRVGVMGGSHPEDLEGGGGDRSAGVGGQKRQNKVIKF